MSNGNRRKFWHNDKFSLLQQFLYAKSLLNAHRRRKIKITLNHKIITMKKKLLLLSCIFLLQIACKESTKPKPSTQKNESTALAKAPVFSAENTYRLIEKQLAFGARVPNSVAHQQMAIWLADTLKQYADTIYIQKADLKAFDGTILKSTNIIASFNPENKKRMLVAAHWDTRPFADQDTENQNQAIAGANDGASGVAVLIELARLLSIQKVSKGIDLIFFDSEDYGQPTDSEYPYMPHSYCLGSQYWAKNLHTPNYDAQFGILLDMVGAKDAEFTQEGHSVQFANHYVQKVWNYGKILGYGKYFKFNKTNPITDDHYYVNTIANIPTLDIIQHDRTTSSGFGAYWHTHQDDIEIIDTNTLKAVGQTVTQVIYQFNEGKF